MNEQNTAVAQDHIVNGVDVDTVMGVIGAIEERHEDAAFQFRLRNQWSRGGSNTSEVQGFFALGREDTTRQQAFQITADEPQLTSGSDQAPNPMEYLLHSLAACMTSTMVYHAAVQGIGIGALSSRLSGDMDVRGMLGMSDEVRQGFGKVRVEMQVSSEADVDTLKSLALFSPVYDLMSSATEVEVVVTKR